MTTRTRLSSRRVAIELTQSAIEEAATKIEAAYAPMLKQNRQNGRVQRIRKLLHEMRRTRDVIAFRFNGHIPPRRVRPSP